MTSDTRGALRNAIDDQQGRLAASLPADRRGLVVALLAEQDAPALAPLAPGPLDVVTGAPMPDLGISVALALCLADGPVPDAGAPSAADREAARALLAACRDLAAAEMVLAHAETGFMGLAVGPDGRLEAWVARRFAPAVWRERAEVTWLTERDTAAVPFAHQFPYPPETVVGGATAATHRAALAALRTLPPPGQQPADAEGRVLVESEVVAMLAARLGLDPAAARRVLGGFVLDAANAAAHAAPPGAPAAPLVRLDANRLAWSRHGLGTWPLLFLARELRRQNPAAYHNAAAAREGVFREELLGRFAGPRFVRAPGRIALRQAGGDLGTDVDAVLFDRRAGVLATFELKSHDPFAESAAALLRQRDATLQANRQVARTMAWLQRNGGDALLARMLPTAREGSRASVRVAKALPFVLGRYLVAFDDGPPRDPRAAWGTWPEVLRLLDGPADPASRSPLASLFAGLRRAAPTARLRAAARDRARPGAADRLPERGGGPGRRSEPPMTSAGAVPRRSPSSESAGRRSAGRRAHCWKQ